MAETAWKRVSYLKMFLNTRIIFYFLSNDIQYIFTYLKICFKKYNKVFAIVWIHPNTILKAKKPEVRNGSSEFVSHTLSVFIYIKDNNSPFAIPSFGLFNKNLMGMQ